jgi:hypothetical protein
MFPESAAALGKQDAEMKPTAEQIAFVELTRGFHF